MSSSEKKVTSNRTNGQKSRGPKNTTSTRFNAAKHGLLAVGITELDDAEGYRTILGDLMREKNPVGAVETFLIKSAALDMVRWLRARRLEAEYITSELNPPIKAPDPLSGLDLVFEGQFLDPGLPAPMSSESGQRLVNIFQRYETNIANRLFRIFHELERLQRMRQGEHLPAPVSVDVSVRADTGVADAVQEDPGILCFDPAKNGTAHSALIVSGQSIALPDDVDRNVCCDNGTPDSTPKKSKSPSGDADAKVRGDNAT